MKEIITTPCDKKFSFIVIKAKGEKLNISNLPVFKALNTPNKHLFVEYDENDDNLLKQCIDLDALGLSHITDIEELEKYFYRPYINEEIEL